MADINKIIGSAALFVLMFLSDITIRSDPAFASFSISSQTFVTAFLISS